MPTNPNWRKEKRKTGGSIKVINGRIFARIQYLDETTGKRKEKLREAPNRSTARSVIKEMRTELERGGPEALESDKTTFSQVAARYSKARLVPPIFQNGIKVLGKRSYRDQISKLKTLVSYFGNKRIRWIRAGELETFKAERLREPVVIERNVRRIDSKSARKKFIREKVKVSRPRTIASVNRELSLLRQIFIFAKAQDLISRNPFEQAPKLISTAAEVVRDRVLTHQEEELLLAACELESRKHIRPIVITAIDTAMRKGELLKLERRDVDLVNSQITIRATNSKTERKRIVGMTSRVQAEIRSVVSALPPGSDVLVFGIRSNFKRAWASALEAIGCRDLRFHDLRHTAITRMIRAGVSTSEAMKISGHSDMKTFQRYVNLTNDSVMSSAAKLERFNLELTALVDEESNSIN